MSNTTFQCEEMLTVNYSSKGIKTSIKVSIKFIDSTSQVCVECCMATRPVNLHLTQAGLFLAKADQFWIPKLVRQNRFCLDQFFRDSS